jgi:hypothetical protein
MQAEVCPCVQFQALSKLVELLLRATAIVHRMDCMDRHPELGICPVLSSLRGDGRLAQHDSVSQCAQFCAPSKPVELLLRATAIVHRMVCMDLHPELSVCPVLSLRVD